MIRASTVEIDLPAIREAAGRIAGFAVRTPLIRSLELSERCGAAAMLKLENLQSTGSFKVRGAANKILSLPPDAQRRGVVACSSGNHALAVAWVADRVGIPATLCLPRWIDPAKLAAVRRLGGEALLCGDTYDEADAFSRRLERERGLTYVHAFDDAAVIAGQGTIGLELLEDEPRIGTVVVPLSGGGLIGGIGTAFKSVAPRVRVIAAYAERAAVMVESISAGRPLEMPEEETVATALSGGIGLENRHTFRLVQRVVDDFVPVSEEQIADAMAFAWREHRLVVEGGGAVALAAQRSTAAATSVGALAVVVSGGNIDLMRFQDAVAAAEASRRGNPRRNPPC